LDIEGTDDSCTGAETAAVKEFPHDPQNLFPGRLSCPQARQAF
jgi:hypothetical protein